MAHDICCFRCGVRCSVLVHGLCGGCNRRVGHEEVEGPLFGVPPLAPPDGFKLDGLDGLVDPRRPHKGAR